MADQLSAEQLLSQSGLAPVLETPDTGAASAEALAEASGLDLTFAPEQPRDTGAEAFEAWQNGAFGADDPSLPPEANKARRTAGMAALESYFNTLADSELSKLYKTGSPALISQLPAGAQRRIYDAGRDADIEWGEAVSGAVSSLWDLGKKLGKGQLTLVESLVPDALTPDIVNEFLTREGIKAPSGDSMAGSLLEGAAEALVYEPSDMIAVASQGGSALTDWLFETPVGYALEANPFVEGRRTRDDSFANWQKRLAAKTALARDEEARGGPGTSRLFAQLYGEPDLKQTPWINDNVKAVGDAATIINPVEAVGGLALKGLSTAAGKTASAALRGTKAAVTKVAPALAEAPVEMFGMGISKAALKGKEGLKDFLNGIDEFGERVAGVDNLGNNLPLQGVRAPFNLALSGLEKAGDVVSATARTNPFLTSRTPFFSRLAKNTANAEWLQKIGRSGVGKTLDAAGTLALPFVRDTAESALAGGLLYAWSAENEIEAGQMIGATAALGPVGTAIGAAGSPFSRLTRGIENRINTATKGRFLADPNKAWFSTAPSSRTEVAPTPYEVQSMREQAEDAKRGYQTLPEDQRPEVDRMVSPDFWASRFDRLSNDPSLSDEARANFKAQAESMRKMTPEEKEWFRIQNLSSVMDFRIGAPVRARSAAGPVELDVFLYTPEQVSEALAEQASADGSLTEEQRAEILANQQRLVGAGNYQSLKGKYTEGSDSFAQEWARQVETNAGGASFAYLDTNADGKPVARIAINADQLLQSGYNFWETFAHEKQHTLDQLGLVESPLGQVLEDALFGTEAVDPVTGTRTPLTQGSMTEPELGGYFLNYLDRAGSPRWTLGFVLSKTSDPANRTRIETEFAKTLPDGTKGLPKSALTPELVALMDPKAWVPYARSEVRAEVASASYRDSTKTKGGLGAFENSLSRRLIDWAVVTEAQKQAGRFKSAFARVVKAFGGELTDHRHSSLLKMKVSPLLRSLHRQFVEASRAASSADKAAREREEKASAVTPEDVANNPGAVEYFRNAPDLFEVTYRYDITDEKGNTVATPILTRQQAEELGVLPKAKFGIVKATGGKTRFVPGEGRELAKPKVDLAKLLAEAERQNGGPLPKVKEYKVKGVSEEIARDVAGKPTILSKTEVQRRLSARAKLVERAIRDAAQDGSPSRMIETTPGHWAGVPSVSQVTALLELDDIIFPAQLKQNLATVWNIIAGDQGGRVQMEYQAALKDGRYASLSPKFRDAAIQSIHLSKAGNLLLTDVSASRIYDKLYSWADTGRLAPWGNDVEATFQDLVDYLSNHKNGLPGATGLDKDPDTAIRKRNILNDLLNLFDKETRASNPDRKSGKGDIDRVIASRRLDRITRIYDNSENLVALPIFLDSVKKNFLPSGEETVGATTIRHLSPASVAGVLRPSSMGETPAFMPSKAEGIPALQEWAEKFAGRALEYDYLPLPSADLMKALADQQQDAVHDPENPAVRAAYEALASDLLDQYENIVKPSGIRVEIHDDRDKEGKITEPYAGAKDMMAKVKASNVIRFLKTDTTSFGDGSETKHPMLEPALDRAGNQITLPNSRTGKEEPVLWNDLFRAVHDLLGHGLNATEFGPRGEFNAWRAHSALFSPLAQPALAAETLDQNAYVNNARYLRRPDGSLPVKGDPDFVPPAERRFADQKAYLSDPSAFGLLSPAEIEFADVESRAVPAFMPSGLQDAMREKGFDPNPLFHGTTRDWVKFDVGKSYAGNYFGKGVYLSSSRDDAAQNYASPLGLDISYRVMSRAQELREAAGENPFLRAAVRDRFYEQAEREIVGPDRTVKKLVVRVKNPLYMGNIHDERDRRVATVTSFDEAQLSEFIQSLSQKLGPKFDPQAFKTRVERSRDWAWELATKGGGYPIPLGRVSAGVVLAELKNVPSVGLIGESAAETFRSVVEEMGYDSIVDPDVSGKFKAQRLMSGTVHTVVFDPRNVKSAEEITRDDEGNEIPLEKRFDVEVNDIRFLPGGDTLVGPTNFNIRAWHGTPHRVKDGRFDLSKIGTGEGAQAYGWGLYFAGSKAVANEYVKISPNSGQLRAPRRFIKGVEVEPGSAGYHAARLVRDESVDLNHARRMVRKWITEVEGKPERSKELTHLQEVLKVLDGLTSKRDATVKDPEGNLYEVNILADENKMLDWDAPLKDQPKAVQDALAKVDPDLWDVLVSDDYDINEGGASMYLRLSNEGGYKGASETLREAGLHGIKYLDGNSRSKGKGSYNYVLFDPELVQTVSRNGSPNFLPAAGANPDDPAQVKDAAKQWALKGTDSTYFKKWFGESQAVGTDGKPERFVVRGGVLRPSSGVVTGVPGFSEPAFMPASDRVGDMVDSSVRLIFNTLIESRKQGARGFSPSQRRDFLGNTPTVKEWLNAYQNSRPKLRADPDAGELANRVFYALRDVRPGTFLSPGELVPYFRKEAEGLSELALPSTSGVSLPTPAKSVNWELVTKGLRDLTYGPVTERGVDLEDKFVVRKRFEGLVSPTKRARGPNFMPSAADATVGGFFSQLGRTLDEKFTGKTATPEQVKGVITNPQNRVRADEIKWSGILPKIDELAAANGGKVPVEALKEWFANNGRVRFEEKVMGGDASAEEKRHNDWVASERERLNRLYGDIFEKAFRKAQKHFIDEVKPRLQPAISTVSFETLQGEFDRANPRVPGTWAAYIRDLVRKVSPESEVEFQANRAEFKALPDFKKKKDDTVYGQYTLPGGENYREIILQFPRPSMSQTEWWESLPPEKKSEYDHHSEDALTGLYEEWVKNSASRSSEYTSPHFTGTPDYLAHMRLKDRADAEGRVGTFIEELQSDRHQAGRDQGYKEEVPPLTWVEDNGWWMGQDPNGVTRTAGNSRAEAEQTLAGRKGIPDAPFRKDWALALFKRVLRDAVEAGHEWVGWTTGDTQNKRFSLSSHISSLTVTDDDGVFVLNAYDLQGRDAMQDRTSFTPEELEGVVGRELAQRIISDFDRSKHSELAKEVGNLRREWQVLDGKGSPDADSAYEKFKARQKEYQETTPPREKTYDGLDLEVGGEGMKGFYDDILPKEVAKYVKQWGAKVEPSTLSVAEGASVYELEKSRRDEPIHKVLITPAMRLSVAQGQPAFMPASGETGYLAAKKIYDAENPEDFAVWLRHGSTDDIFAEPSKAWLKNFGYEALRRPDGTLLLVDPAAFATERPHTEPDQPPKGARKAAKRLKAGMEEAKAARSAKEAGVTSLKALPKTCSTPGCQNLIRLEKGKPKGDLCNTCRAKQNRDRNPLTRQFQDLKDSAKKRGKEFTLTRDEFEELVRDSDYYRFSGVHPSQLTIDRIDVNGPYSKENTRVITNRENASHSREDEIYYADPSEMDFWKTPMPGLLKAAGFVAVRESDGSLTRLDEVKPSGENVFNATDEGELALWEGETQFPTDEWLLSNGYAAMRLPGGALHIPQEPATAQENATVPQEDVNRGDPAFMPAGKTDSPEFKKWFGNSVFRDKDGNPITFYHGTRKAGWTEANVDAGANERRKTGIFLSNRARVSATYSGPTSDDNFIALGKDIIADPEGYGFEIKKVWALPKVLSDDLVISEDADADADEALAEWAEAYTYMARHTREKAARLGVEVKPVVQWRATGPDGNTYTAETEEDLAEQLDSASLEEKPGIYDLYVAADAEDVLEVDWQGRNWDDGPEETVWDFFPKGGDPDTDVEETFYDFDEAVAHSKKHPELDFRESKAKTYYDTNDAARSARDMGMKALWIRNVDDPGPYSRGSAEGDVVVVFDNKAIKSATTNTGAYDPENPDIRFMPAGAPKEWQGKDVTLTHWSNQKGLKKTDPKKFGTAGAGAEKARQKAAPKLWIPRTYFGYAPYRREDVLGSNRYTATVPGDSIYDMDSDPLDLYPDKAEVKAAGYAPMDRNAAESLHEKKIKEAGFAGYVSKAHKIVAMFEPVPVAPAPARDIAEKAVDKPSRSVKKGGAMSKENQPNFLPAPSAFWVDPSGKLHTVPNGDHDEFAAEQLGLEPDPEEGSNIEKLKAKGWLRGRRLGQTIYVSAGGLNGLKTAQSRALKDLAEENNYEDVKFSNDRVRDHSVNFLPASLATEADIRDLPKRQNWAILSPENPKATKATEEENARFRADFEKDLKARGVPYEPIRGSYGSPEKSYFLPDISEADALALGKTFGQESVITPKGLVFQNGDYNALKDDVTIYDEEPEDFFSVAPGGIFSLSFDFDTKLDKAGKPVKSEE